MIDNSDSAVTSFVVVAVAVAVAVADTGGVNDDDDDDDITVSAAKLGDAQPIVLPSVGINAVAVVAAPPTNPPPLPIVAVAAAPVAIPVVTATNVCIIPRRDASAPDDEDAGFGVV